MFATVRIYENHAALADALIARRTDIENLIKQVPGLVGYHVVKLPTGLLTMTVCETQAGADDSIRRAAEFIRTEIAGNIAGAPPKILSGDVVATVMGATARA